MESLRPVLVTGASGFIGWHVVRELRRLERPVRALVRVDSQVQQLRSLGVEIYVGDLLEADSLAAAVKGCSAVVHLAGAMQGADEEAYRRVNVDGTLNLLDAVARHGRDVRRFVFVSSLAAVGPACGADPPDESAEPRPVGPYGRTKLEAEAEVLERRGRLAVTVFRPPIVYGPRDRKLLPYFQLIRAGLLLLPGEGKQRVAVIHARDLAAAMVQALSRGHPSGSVFHLCDGPARRWRDLGEAIRLVQGTPAITVRVPKDAMRWARRAGRIALRWTPRLPVWLHPDALELALAGEWTCADGLIRRTLGWVPKVTLLEGLAETVDWYREAGWLLRPWGGPLNRREVRPSKVPPETDGSGRRTGGQER